MEYLCLKKEKRRRKVETFAEGLLEIPCAMAQNAGHDTVDCIVNMQAAADRGEVRGINIETGELLDPVARGTWDIYCIKREMLQCALLVATQLLLVDEVLKAGVQMQK